jgi:hypothetical protein
MVAPPRHHRITPKELFDWMQWHGLGQADLAESLGYSRRSVYSWLEGDTRTPRNLYDLLCTIYGEPYVPEYKADVSAGLGATKRVWWNK